VAETGSTTRAKHHVGSRSGCQAPPADWPPSCRGRGCTCACEDVARHRDGQRSTMPRRARIAGLGRSLTMLTSRRVLGRAGHDSRTHVSVPEHRCDGATVGVRAGDESVDERQDGTGPLCVLVRRLTARIPALSWLPLQNERAMRSRRCNSKAARKSSARLGREDSSAQRAEDLPCARQPAADRVG
jgi:hypothetical protein